MHLGNGSMYHKTTLSVTHRRRMRGFSVVMIDTFPTIQSTCHQKGRIFLLASNLKYLEDTGLAIFFSLLRHRNSVEIIANQLSS